MKHILAIVLILFVAGSIATGVNPGLGWYWADMGWWWAANEDVCIHEMAHKMDHEGGWISRTNDYYWGIKDYKKSQLGVRSTFNDWLFTYQFELRELYADMYSFCHGHKECIPQELQGYYNFDRGNTLIQERCMGYGMPKE